MLYQPPYQHFAAAGPAPVPHSAHTAPGAAAAPGQLEGPSWCSASLQPLRASQPLPGWRAQGLSLREDWHKLLVVTDAHLTSSDSGIFFQAVTLFEQIAFV